MEAIQKLIFIQFIKITFLGLIASTAIAGDYVQLTSPVTGCCVTELTAISGVTTSPDEFTNPPTDIKVIIKVNRYGLDEAWIDETLGFSSDINEAKEFWPTIDGNGQWEIDLSAVSWLVNHDIEITITALEWQEFNYQYYQLEEFTEIVKFGIETPNGNNPPGSFSIIYPDRNAYIDEDHAIWKPSVDPEGDVVSYVVAVTEYGFDNTDQLYKCLPNYWVFSDPQTEVMHRDLHFLLENNFIPGPIPEPDFFSSTKLCMVIVAIDQYGNFTNTPTQYFWYVEINQVPPISILSGIVKSDQGAVQFALAQATINFNNQVTLTDSNGKYIVLLNGWDKVLDEKLQVSLPSYISVTDAKIPDGAYDGEFYHDTVMEDIILEYDADGDGVGSIDNCPNVPNADQADLDIDTIGDVCDPDIDGDGVLNGDDAFPLASLEELTDTDGDGRPDDCNTDCLNAGMTADSDDDGDGYSDIEEDAAGTNPKDATDYPIKSSRWKAILPLILNQ